MCCVTKWPRVPRSREWRVAVRWHCSAPSKPHIQIQTYTGTEKGQMVSSSLSCTGTTLDPVMQILLGVDLPCSIAWATKPSTWWSPLWGLKTLLLTTVLWDSHGDAGAQEVCTQTPGHSLAELLLWAAHVLEHGILLPRHSVVQSGLGRCPSVPAKYEKAWSLAGEHPDFQWRRCRSTS